MEVSFVIVLMKWMDSTMLILVDSSYLVHCSCPVLFVCSIKVYSVISRHNTLHIHRSFTFPNTTSSLRLAI